MFCETHIEDKHSWPLEPYPKCFCKSQLIWAAFYFFQVKPRRCKKTSANESNQNHKELSLWPKFIFIKINGSYIAARIENFFHKKSMNCLPADKYDNNCLHDNEL